MGKIFGLFFGLLVFIIIVFVGSVIGKSCNTASQMANKTIFNAQGHVVSYEQFRDDYQAYQRYVSSYCELARRKDLSMEEKVTKNGYYKMAMDVAQRYNANAMKLYKDVWRGELPEKLPLTINCDNY